MSEIILPTQLESARIETLLTNEKDFESFIYTSKDEAIAELKRRQSDLQLTTYIQKTLPVEIPGIMHDKQCAVLFRHIATSNFEVEHFLNVVSDTGLVPLILEYTEDKFTNRNELKFSLGKLHFHKGVSKTGQPIVENLTIIDINKSNNASIASIQTLFGESLVAFHHELFLQKFPEFKDAPHDLSNWLHQVGPTAKDYYKSFLTLFLQNGILFENFIAQGAELSFTREIILPAIMDISAESGVKPLIVPLEPSDVTNDPYWLSYPFETKSFVENKFVNK